MFADHDPSREPDSAARNLPAVPADLEVDVLDGQVVDDPPPRPVVVVLRPVVQVVQVVLVVVRHEHTRTAGRHLGFIPLGAVVVARRLWESRSTARYDKAIRAAQQTGDQKTALEWDQRRAEFVKARHERRMQRAESRRATARTLPWFALGAVVVLFVVGVLLAIGRHRIADVAEPVEILAHITEVAAAVAAAAWGPIILAAPWAAVAGLWHVGRREASVTPGWGRAVKPGAEDSGMVVTADALVLALQNVRIPELKRAFKDGWRPAFHQVPVRDGLGYSAVFGVPLGVTAEMVADQRAVFARNLHRAEIEVWPSDAERGGIGPAGTVAVWVADRGVLDKPAPEYPLLSSGTADVFEGVPAGVSPRGDTIAVPIVGNNFVAGGIMGQGKSNACRVLMLGAALDPLAELWVHVFAYNGDFDAYAPRLARYVKGAEDEQIAAAMDSLHELYAEVGRREARLAELGAKKVTRKLAGQHPDLRPRLALFSECHELFGHPEFGEEATELAVATQRRARKTALWMGYDTQDARKDAIPPKLVGLVSVNCCFAVKTWRANDGFLGDGSFAAGIRATELRPGRDRGRSLITGVSDAQFELLKWHLIEVDDDTGYDAAAEVIARAMANVAPGTPTGAHAPVTAIEVRDLLDDIAEVVAGSADRVKVNDLPAMLRKLAPAWRPYRSLTGKQLRELLDAEGVRVTNTGNVPQLDPSALQDVLSPREPGELVSRPSPRNTAVTAVRGMRLTPPDGLTHLTSPDQRPDEEPNLITGRLTPSRTEDHPHGSPDHPRRRRGGRLVHLAAPASLRPVPLVPWHVPEHGKHPATVRRVQGMRRQREAGAVRREVGPALARLNERAAAVDRLDKPTLAKYLHGTAHRAVGHFVILG